MAASDKEWIADVQRWCLEGRRLRDQGLSADATHHEDVGAALGYEAAQPVLQASQWPDARSMEFLERR